MHQSDDLASKMTNLFSPRELGVDTINIQQLQLTNFNEKELLRRRHSAASVGL